MPPPSPTDPLRQRLPRWVVARPQVERRLDEVVGGGLGLVVASAGYGKSVLVRQWCSSRPRLAVAALALTERHDDAVVLARDLLSAIRRVAPQLDPDLDHLVTAGGSSLGAAFVQGLLEVLEDLAEGVILVLEDAHALSSSPVIDDLGRLLTALPDTARGVVTTRWDPPWPLHRLRLDDRLVEIRGADLAFRDDDAQALLANVAHRDLDDGLVRKLVDRTDGWAVGLQLAAISLRTTPDVASFVESFAGGDHLVAEYLLDEVIERQEPDVRRFLLHTSILDWLSPDQCDAVTVTGNSRAMLHKLYGRSMFLIPLDGSGERFRYHHLFAEVLRYRLRIEDPGAVDGLQHAAARWLLQHGREEEAVRHLIDAGDPTEAFRVISTVGHRLFERGEAATLVRWLRAIGAEDPKGPAAVEISLLAAQLGADDAAAASETYRRIGRRPGLTLGERTAANALFSLLALRDLPPEAVLRVTDDVRDAVPLLGPEEAIDFLGIGGTDSVQAVAEYTAGLAHFFSGDLHRAATALERVRALPGMRYPVWHVYVLGSLALVRAWQGHCTDAVGLARSAIEEARAFGISRHQGSTHAHLALALVHLDRVELDQAQHSLAEATMRIRGRAASATYFDVLDALRARLAAVREGPAEALAQLGSPSASGTEAPVLSDARRAIRARLLVGTGDLAGARAVIDGADDGGSVLAPSKIDLALAGHDVPSARKTLDTWTTPPGDLRAEIRHLLRDFRVLRAEGDHRAAEKSLRTAVAAARGERHRWAFLEVPTALRAVRRGVGRAPWLTDDELWGMASRLEPDIGAQESLVEPLTDRELAVLAYLPGRMRYQEIAADLFVSVNTVKSHVSSIYRKLGVAERNEAVARAAQLDLL